VVFGFTITDGRVVEIELLADPERLRQLDLAILDDCGVARDHRPSSSQVRPEFRG
jgi:hypothetical protein